MITLQVSSLRADLAEQATALARVQDSLAEALDDKEELRQQLQQAAGAEMFLQVSFPVL